MLSPLSVVNKDSLLSFTNGDGTWTFSLSKVSEGRQSCLLKSDANMTVMAKRFVPHNTKNTDWAMNSFF